MLQAAHQLRQYAIRGKIPAPILWTRESLIGGTIPPRMMLPVIAWMSYWLAKPELRVMKSLVDPARTSIDVGANIGVHTYFLARWSQQVYAYEPNPGLAAFLRRSCARNVTLSPLALSDRVGKATLNVPVIAGRAADPYASLDDHVAELVDDGGAIRRLEISTDRLDSFDFSNVGFIKIDVEGHEASVIAGATATLRRERPTLLVEINQLHHRGDIRDVFEQVMALGYEARFLFGTELKPIDAFSVEAHQRLPLVDQRAGPFVENFVFTPTER